MAPSKPTFLCCGKKRCDECDFLWTFEEDQKPIFFYDCKFKSHLAGQAE